MSVISVINYKGGVGKTTLTANLAAELAYKGKKVLVLDLDPQANLTFSFMPVDVWRAQEDRTIKTWFDGFIDNGTTTDLADLIVVPEKVNSQINGSVEVICSHLGLINVDLELAVMLGGANPRQQNRNYVKVHSLLANGLRQVLEKAEYDVVLVDCPPNFNIVTKTAIVASDYYMVPAKPDYLSTLGIEQLNRHVEELVADYNSCVERCDLDVARISPKMLGIVFTMIAVRDGQPISAQKQYIEQIKKKRLPVFKTHIRENKTKYASAPEYGIPVVLHTGLSGTYLDVRTELEKLTAELRSKVGL